VKARNETQHEKRQGEAETENEKHRQNDWPWIIQDGAERNTNERSDAWRANYSGQNTGKEGPGAALPVRKPRADILH
jgi:hypothetical protein